MTGVDHVYIHYGQPNQEKLEKVTASQLKAWKDQQQFAAGSMLPKVEAAIAFVEAHPSGKAIITSLENIANVISEGSGTQITAN